MLIKIFADYALFGVIDDTVIKLNDLLHDAAPDYSVDFHNTRNHCSTTDPTGAIPADPTITVYFSADMPLYYYMMDNTLFFSDHGSGIFMIFNYIIVFPHKLCEDYWTDVKDNYLDFDDQASDYLAHKIVDLLLYRQTTRC